MAVIAQPLFEHLPDRGMDLLNLFVGRHQPGSYRPYRFVGDDEIGARCSLGNGFSQLPADNFDRPPLITLVPRFTDTDIAIKPAR